MGYKIKMKYFIEYEMEVEIYNASLSEAINRAEIVCNKLKFIDDLSDRPIKYNDGFKISKITKPTLKSVDYINYIKESK